MAPGMAPGMGYEGGYGGQGPMPAEELQRQALQLADAMGSESLRVKVAKFLLGPDASGPQIQQLLPMIEKTRPDNITAQLLMYQSDKPTQPAKVRLEQYFTQCSSLALGRAMRILAEEKAREKAAPANSPWGGARQGRQGGAAGGRRTLGAAGRARPGRRTGDARRGRAGRRRARRDDARRWNDARVGMMPGGMGYPAGMNVPNLADDPELLYKAARQLWDPGVAAVVGQRLEDGFVAEGGQPVGRPGADDAAGRRPSGVVRDAAGAFPGRAGSADLCRAACPAAE